MRRSRLIWPMTSTKTGHLDSARAVLGLQRKIRWEAESGKSCHIRYALSVAGDPTRRNIRQAQISPKLNIGLSERWFITLYPSYDVRINYGPAVPGQTGRLFLPFDVAVGREISKGVQLSLEVSVPIIRDFPVYNFKTEIRMVARF